MTSPALDTLLKTLGGEQLPGFVLVLARLAPLFVLAPLFSSKLLPARVRGIVAVALALGLTGLATHGQHIPTQPLPLAGLMVVQILVGLGFAFAVGAVMIAVEAAGSLADSVSGFSFGSTLDPINGNPGGVLTKFYSLVGVLIFIAIGGDAWVLRGVGRTFTLIPLTDPIRLTSLVAGATHTFGTIFVSALEVAAPALLALLITDVAFGMVSRVMPQLNVFAVGFPMKVGVALLVTGTVLAFLGSWMTDQLQSSVGSALQALQIG